MTESTENTLPAPSEPARPRERPRKPPEPSLLIGRGDAIRDVIRTAEEVARSGVTVLIEGESGTGKELVARYIHATSPRADKPFIFVNCAALPEHLVEAELFGHVKGAFTDARSDKPGRFMLADGGTLFLDEIGDLPHKGQGDLLRVIEDGAFRMVGGTELMRVDVRIIAATNKDLTEAVAAGKFREDLLYRLQVIPISVPPSGTGLRTYRSSWMRSSITLQRSTSAGARPFRRKRCSCASGFRGRATSGNCATSSSAWS